MSRYRASLSVVGSSTVKHKSYTHTVLTTLVPLDGLINDRITREHSPRAREASDLATQSSRFFAGARMSKSERRSTSPSLERRPTAAPATPARPCRPGTLSACQKHAAGRILLPPTRALAGESESTG